MKAKGSAEVKTVRRCNRFNSFGYPVMPKTKNIVSYTLYRSLLLSLYLNECDAIMGYGEVATVAVAGLGGRLKGKWIGQG